MRKLDSLYKHTANPKLTKLICPDAAARRVKTACEIVRLQSVSLDIFYNALIIKMINIKNKIFMQYAG